MWRKWVMRREDLEIRRYIYIATRITLSILYCTCNCTLYCTIFIVFKEKTGSNLKLFFFATFPPEITCLSQKPHIFTLKIWKKLDIFWETQKVGKKSIKKSEVWPNVLLVVVCKASFHHKVVLKRLYIGISFNICNC